MLLEGLRLLFRLRRIKRKLSMSPWEGNRLSSIVRTALL